MITPELENYIKQARAQGINDAQIRQNLLSGGWSEADLTQAGLVSSVVSSSPSAPATPAVESVITVSPEQVQQIQQKSKTGVWVYVLVFIIFLILGAGGGYAYYKFFNKTQDITTKESVMVSQPEIITEENTPVESAEETIPIPVGTETEIKTMPPAPVCVAVPTGLVAWYAGDDNTKDIKNANDGTPKGVVKYIAGMAGQAFSLNGVDAFVQAPSSALNDPTISGSLSAWVKFNSLPSASHIMQIIGKGGNGTDFDLQANKDDKFHFYIGAGTHVGSTTIIKTGVWYHLVGTWDSVTGMKMYVNGVLENTNTIKVSRKPSGKKLEIGHQPVFSGRFLNGIIDEAMLAISALSVEEIFEIYKAGSVGICKPAPVTTTTSTP